MRKLVNRIQKRSASTWVLVLLAAFQLWQIGLHQSYRSPNASRWPVTSDGLGYYAYLPATFLHQDFTYTFIPQEITGSQDFYNSISTETGFKINKYPIGVAVLQLPFFLLGHAAAYLTQSPMNGFSVPYRFWLIIGALFYQILGLLLVRRMLRFFFKEGIVALVILGLVMGTNLLYYTIHESMMSHVFSFFAMAAASYYSMVWHRDKQRRELLMSAGSFALVCLIRTFNVIFLLFFLILGIRNSADASLRIKLIWRKRQDILWAGLLGFAILGLQLVTWKLTTGSWLVFSYAGEGFLWSEPAITDVLWSYRKGWWVYTPLAVVMLLGLLVIPRYVRGARLAIFSYLVIHLYLISSWWSWWYGGGFGMRPMVEVLAPLSLALGAIISFCFRQKRLKYAFISTFVLLLSFNFFQTYQMKRGYIHPENMTSAAYWAIFGKANLTKEERKEMEKRLALPPLERRAASAQPNK